MSEPAQAVTPVNIEEELRQSYLDYAMSVIVGRALPDVRDGLKPVHRRVLFAMKELGNTHDKAYKKSARIVGDVIGKYHPHGDQAAYDTIVRMAQEFSLRYPLVDGQGNFGSIDGDSAAAMRYTEIRMTRLAHLLLADLDKETVNFVPNYDGTEQMPEVLPTRVPNLLVNGSGGIAVGMATTIPPHNMSETVRAALALLDNPDLGVDALMAYIPGPDFPTAGIINGRAGILDAYRTGKGRIYVRARCEVIRDEKRNRDTIIVSELPYQVNKARLIEKIAELVKEGKIKGISELRDESSKEGIRVVMELKRGEDGEVLLNNLYRHTQLETVIGINLVALENNQPKTFNLREILDAFLRHRREVVVRRTIFDLRKAREKGHVLEGLAVALGSIDPVIDAIRQSPNREEARVRLMSVAWPSVTVEPMLERAGADACKPEGLPDGFGLLEEGYRLSEQQAQAILDMRLHRLTGMEQDKLIEDYRQVLDIIADLGWILSDPDRLRSVIREELEEVLDVHGDDRKTEIIESRRDLTTADLVTEEEVVITLSRNGYIKRQPIEIYDAQRRGGRGKAATGVRDEDFIEYLSVVNTHDTVMLFSSGGKVFWLRGFEVPQFGRTSRGETLAKLLSYPRGNELVNPLQGERITAMMSVGEYTSGHYVFMATASGTVKKTPLDAFARQRSSGLIAIDLADGDELIDVAITDGQSDIMLVTSNGKAMRFNEQDVRSMGRTARGVRGVRLANESRVMSMMVLDDSCQVLTTSENGFGKRTPVSEFPLRLRGGQGVIAMQCTERNGQISGAVMVAEQDEIMLITDGGTLVRTRVSEISSLGRNTQGVGLIRLGKGEKLVSIARIDEALIGGATPMSELPQADNEASREDDSDQGTEAVNDGNTDE
jgi:DNA gyrase subunit A